MKIRTILIDDESKARSALRMEINHNCPEVEIIGEAGTVEEGSRLIRKLNPDLIFLDIQLSDGLGFHVLEASKSQNLQVIFVTAYEEYALKAIKFNALDYLLKPVDGEELRRAVEKVRHRRISGIQHSLEKFFRKLNPDPQDQRIAVHAQNGIFFYDVANIVRLESDGNYSRLFFLDEGPVLASKPLKEFEEMLESHSFVRVHRSHLVNISQVKGYLKGDENCLIMRNGDKIPVSQRKRQEFLNLLNGQGGGERE